ncbi:MAG: transglycosylase domain-containing protein [Tissierellia bacterium]|nr:transglycosylase domain-containing protein [Tissierellia bacterium]
MKRLDLNKKQKIHISLLIVLSLIILTFSLLVSILMGIIKDTPVTKLDNLSNSFNQTSTIYTEDGKLLEKIESLEYRTVVDLDKMPLSLRNAFLAIEDHRFYRHKGLDPRGIAGALITNFKTKSFARGGSTITQQLVKNVYLSNTKSIPRKVQEAYLALRVEDRLSKDEILEAYLNRINLGQGAYGVQAAAQTYFSKNVWDLNIAESALLAGIAKSPLEYPPFKTVPAQFMKDEFTVLANRQVNGEEMYLVLNDNAFERQQIVLKRMNELGYISDKEYKTAKNFNIIDDLNPGIKRHHNMSSYSTDFIKQQASKELARYFNISFDEGEHKLFTGGYRIISSIDEEMQRDLEKKYETFLDFVKLGSSKGGAKLLNFEKNDEGSIIYEDEILYFKRQDHFNEDMEFVIPKKNYSLSPRGDLKIDNSYFRLIGDKIDIIDLYDIDESGLLRTYNIGNLNLPKDSFEYKKNYIIIDGSYIKEHESFYRLDQEENLILSPELYNANVKPTYQPQSAAIISDNDTGFVKAIVGGLDIENTDAKILNRATDSYRIPGTLIRPITVYMPALKHHYTMGSVIDDVPIETDGMMWPENDYKGFRGLMTLRQSMENSSNVIAAEILKDIGIESSMEELKKFNIIRDNPKEDYFVTIDENPKRHDMNLDSLALGNMQIGITLDQANDMYSTIANLGEFKKTTAIIRIEDANGVNIVDNRKGNIQLYDEKIAYLLRDGLQGNMKRGMGNKVHMKGATLGGYLGKNRFNSDLWFSAFSDHYTISTWIGSDSPKITLNTDDRFIANHMNRIVSNISDSDDEKKLPDYIVEKYISSKSGNLGTKLTEYAKSGYREKYIKGTEPTEYDNLFKKYLICSDSGLIATQFCPSESVEFRVAFEREPKYDPKKHFGLYPDDYMTIPKSYCNIHTREWYEEHGEKEEENE